MPDLASQEWPLKQCFNPGTLVAHWKARFTSLPVTVRCWQFHILHKYPPVTPLWANSTTVRRPLDKMKAKDWFRQFFLFIYFIIFYFFFGLKLRGTRHLATRLQNTLQWPHFGPTVQPLGDPWTKWSPRTGLDIFFFFILFYYFLFSSDSNCEEQDIWLHGYKIPSSDPTSGQQYNRQATLGQNEAKGLVKTIFSCFILCSDSSCNFEQDIWL